MRFQAFLAGGHLETPFSDASIAYCLTKIKIVGKYSHLSAGGPNAGHPLAPDRSGPVEQLTGPFYWPSFGIPCNAKVATVLLINFGP